MSTTEQRDAAKHRYELVPIVEGQYRGHQIVGDYAREATGEKHSVKEAVELMNSNVLIDRVHVYHSYPSPGPARRLVGRVNRGETRILRET